MRNSYWLIFLLAVNTAGLCLAAEKKILVYTRNYTPDGKGYVHNNIKASVEAIQKLGKENGFAVDVSNDPEVFTDENLKQYKALVFSNSNNEAFANDAQREAFKRYIKAGGGFVGIHSASGSERKWGYYQAVLGAKFRRHPKQQPFTVRVVDPKHPATRDLPASFTWGPDECYYHDNFNKDIKPLLVVDPAELDDPKKDEYPGKRFGKAMPIAWYHTYDGGRQFYTALGHNIPQYKDPLLTKHILGGILWAMGEKPYPGDQATGPGKEVKGKMSNDEAGMKKE
ncbi:MAG TPA: ThuA domain-containing protein [Phycisphaerae bacterium]|jgi:type 1 glutamine amidotransferase|nr:ThuA domain-containing protein [Phycisphaerae bacterium]HOB73702.1 ThuA domain-containing protein [Phycisphaerae bacterium]HOJ53424.1 ThuA domain-containing protein [Phycisphaerae bacterium]HOL25452.1 ThuA domain-containing protein [Phycisphaerae bacterium]HPP19871.1 ThuA domain-containing protein [Phycisphaerae bacterium]